MKFRKFLFAVGVSLLIGLSSHFIGNGDSRFEGRSVRGSIGNVRNLEAAYDRWAARYTLSGGDQQLVLPLGYSKGLSAEFTRAHGQAKFNLIDESVSVTVSGLPEGATYDVWLIDNRPGARHSVKPEPSDALLRLGRLQHAADTATLEADLAQIIHPEFEIDLVAVARGGETPGQGGLLFGSASLFQKLYYSESGGAFAALEDVVTPRRFDSGQPAPWTLPFRAFIPRPAFAAHAVPDLDLLVLEGERIFFNETFDGNGRTCGTCHRAENNFTIDPPFVATLPDDDPLFVAEFIPALNTNFENPELMREFGLILENQDGFVDLENNFNMRGVPHTLALRTSVDSVNGPRTGWGGDATLGPGGLRDFATGAVRQHFPLTLDRTPDIDFRLPTEMELDRLEAFQLSLGRQEDLNLETLKLKGYVPARGQEIFLDGSLGKCNICHLNAGANTERGIGNGNFDTGVEELLDQPADLTGELVPPDDGFGTPGDGRFNTPSLVESADTGPFFHNNAIETIEGAVAFYNGAAFNGSPSSIGRFGVGEIKLDATQIVAVAAFLRVINALENIRSAIALEERHLDANHSNVNLNLLELARADTLDAIDDLRGGGRHPDAVQNLEQAVQRLQLAGKRTNRGKRKHFIMQAIDYQEDARGLMVEE